MQLSLQDKFLKVKLLGQKTQVLVIFVNTAKLPSPEVISLKTLGIHSKRNKEELSERKVKIMLNRHTQKKIRILHLLRSVLAKMRTNEHIRYRGTIRKIHKMGKFRR